VGDQLKWAKLTREDLIRVRDYLLSPQYTKDRFKEIERDAEAFKKWCEWLDRHFPRMGDQLK